MVRLSRARIWPIGLALIVFAGMETVAIYVFVLNRRLTRDLYLPTGSTGFWQGALRDAGDPLFRAAMDAIGGRRPVTVELLYGDHEGGQRTVTRFGLTPVEDGRWLAAVTRHWNLDRPDPR